VSACNYHLRALNHIRSALMNDTAVTVRRAIILSCIAYFNSLLASMSQSNFDRLQRLQNRLVRGMMRLPYRAHVATVRRGLHWLPIHECVEFKLAVMTYETRQTGKPTYIAELLVDRVHNRELCSSADRTQLVLPRTRNVRASRAFSSAAPSTWNAMPSDIRECDTLR